MNGNKTDLGVLGRGAPAGPDRGKRLTHLPAPRSKWKTRLLLPALVLGSAAGLLGYSAREALQAAAEVRTVPVLVKQMAGSDTSGSAGVREAGAVGAEGSAGTVVQAPGWVEADPYVMNVSALVGGVVREVLVLEGDQVGTGEVVARLIDDDARLALAAAEAGLAQREAELAAARADLEGAQREWEHPIEQQRAVAVAEAMAAQIRAELTMLSPQIAVEVAKAQEIREEYQRLLSLRESRALAEGDLVRWEQRLRAQESMVEAARARRGVLEAQLARQEAELEAAREGLRLRIQERRALEGARAGVARAEAAVAMARVLRDESALRLVRMEIRSQASGIVLARLIEPGMRLMTTDDMTGSLALRLYDPARLQVRVDVPLADAMRVAVGQEAQITTEAMPNRVFRGRVSRLVHQANIQKNTVEVKVAVLDMPSDGMHLKPEMLTRVRFAAAPGGERRSGGDEAPAGHAMLIPAETLTEVKGDRARVWVIDQSRRAASSREVRTGRVHDDGWIEVRDGLRPGDRVIIGHPRNLREGLRVRVIADRGGEEWR